MAAANKSLHRTFDPLPIFAFAKTGIASSAGELRRWLNRKVNMGTGRLSSIEPAIERAESYLVAWRYLRWVQMAFGFFLIGWGIYAQQTSIGSNPPLILGVLHPFVIFVLGLGAVSEAFWEKRARDKRLIVALARDHDVAVN